MSFFFSQIIINSLAENKQENSSCVSEELSEKQSYHFEVKILVSSLSKNQNLDGNIKSFGSSFLL